MSKDLGWGPMGIAVPLGRGGGGGLGCAMGEGVWPCHGWGPMSSCAMGVWAGRGGSIIRHACATNYIHFD